MLEEFLTNPVRSVSQIRVNELCGNVLEAGTHVPTEFAMDTSGSPPRPTRLADLTKPTATFEEVDIRSEL